MDGKFVMWSSDWEGSGYTDVFIVKVPPLPDEEPTTTPTYQCSDGMDNDGDALTDYPNDPGCTSTIDNEEYDAPTPTPTPTTDLIALRTSNPITLDGNLDEWTGANSVSFSGTSNNTTSHLLWDNTNLYVAFQVIDTELNALH
jgi:hypothetical protein